MNKSIESNIVRSKRVREIIDKDPPWLIQYGTIIISIVLVVVLYIFLGGF